MMVDPDPVDLASKANADLEKQVELLRDQVDHLQIVSQEKKRPWYRESGTLTSFIAVAFSIVTFLYSQNSQNTEEIRSKKKELRGLVDNILDLRKDLEVRVALLTNPQEKEYEATLLNQKTLIKLAVADALAQQLGDEVSSVELGVLANQHQLYADYKQAEKYYLLATVAKGTDVERVTSMRSLAQYYFGSGPHKNFTKGRKYFDEAVSVAVSSSDPYLSYQIGLTYESWGFGERSNGFTSESNRLFELARKYYNDIPNEVYLKKHAITLLDQRLTTKDYGQPTNPFAANEFLLNKQSK